jgi:hypothetical protein
METFGSGALIGGIHRQQMHQWMVALSTSKLKMLVLYILIRKLSEVGHFFTAQLSYDPPNDLLVHLTTKEEL